MFSNQILFAVLAALTAVSASPVAVDSGSQVGRGIQTEDSASDAIRAELNLPGDDGGDLKTVLFKRDDVLTPRELEEAASAGIDVREMFRHSVVKRADGNDITYWVHNSFVDAPEETSEETSPNLERRQGGQFLVGIPSQADTCSNTSFENRTNRSSPSAGAAWRIVNWCRGNKGFWRAFRSESYMLVGARSASGANAQFRARRRTSAPSDARVGSKNVADITEASINRFASRPGGASQMKRVAARGQTTCRTDVGSRAIVNWALTRQ